MIREDAETKEETEKDSDHTPIDKHLLEPYDTPTIEIPFEQLTFELFPTSSKVFELDLSTSALSGVSVELASPPVPGCSFGFGVERRGVFTQPFKTTLDGKGKLYIQVNTDESSIETETDTSLQIAQDGERRTISVKVRVIGCLPRSSYRGLVLPNV